MSVTITLSNDERFDILDSLTDRIEHLTELKDDESITPDDRADVAATLAGLIALAGRIERRN